MAMVNPGRVKADVVEVSEFPDLGRRYQVHAVPRIVINEKVAFDGAFPEPMFMDKVREALEG